MPNERDKTYDLKPGDTLYIEGKHGIIAISATIGGVSTAVTVARIVASDKTDIKWSRRAS